MSGQIKAQENFFLDDWEPKYINSPAEYIESEKPTNPSNVLVIISFADTITKVSEYNFGNNANVYTSRMWDNLDLVENLKNLNPHVIRYPGGNLSNEFFWDRAPNDRPPDIPSTQNVWYGKNEATWTMSVDNYYKLLDVTETLGIICVNYSYARYGTSLDPVAQAAHYAADWVRYDQGRTKFWEIGNENYGNWQAGYEIDPSLNKDGQPQFISGDLYAKHALVFVDSMKSAAAEIGHEIFIGFQVWEEESSWDPIQTNWNETMMPMVGDIPDFYIVHNYFTPYNENSNAETILDSYKKPRDFKKSVNTDLSEFGLGEKPLALTEYNIFAVSSLQQVSNINGLHAALVTGEVIRNKYGLTSRWDLANGWNNGDDHGMFSKDEPGVTQFTPHPDFYHLTYFQRYFGDVMVKTISTHEDIVVFASSFTSGQAGIAVVNKGPVAKTVALALNNYELGERCYWYLLQDEKGDGSFSRKVFINGEGPAQVAGGPENYTGILPYSFPTDGEVIIESLPYSAIYLLLDGKTVVGIPEYNEANPMNGFQLNQNFPNPFNPVTTINYFLPQVTWIEISIYDNNGHYLLTLAKGYRAAGNHQIRWDASEFASGVYMCTLKTEKGAVQSKKMVLLK